MPYTPVGDRNMFAALKRTMEWGWFGNKSALTQFAQPPTLASGEFLTQLNPGNTGVVSILGLDANQQLGFPMSQAISLTAAQIITLNTVPVQLIPAPGVGFALLLNEIIVEINRTSTQFTGGGVVAPTYHGLATAITSNTIAAASITGTVGQSILALQPNIGAAGGQVLSANLAIDLFAATANFAAGTGTARVFVSYSVLTL